SLERLDHADGRSRDQRADPTGCSSNRAGRAGLALIAGAALDFFAGTFRSAIEWPRVVARTHLFAITAAATPVRPAARSRCVAATAAARAVPSGLSSAVRSSVRRSRVGAAARLLA